MLGVILLNRFEVVLMGVAISLLIVYYKRAGYERKAIIVWVLIFLPVLYSSINMVTEVVTTDEPQYEECITNIRRIKEFAAAPKVLYEYKFTQLTIGTIFG